MFSEYNKAKNKANFIYNKLLQDGFPQFVPIKPIFIIVYANLILWQGGKTMSTLDATVSMIQRCTEDELQVVQQVIRQFFLNRGSQTTTKSQFLEELEISRKQHQIGQCQEADEVLAELRKKYGL